MKNLGPGQELLEKNEPLLNFSYLNSGLVKKGDRYVSCHNYQVYEENVGGDKENIRQVRIIQDTSLR